MNENALDDHIIYGNGRVRIGGVHYTITHCT